MEAAFLASQDLQESSSLDQTESPDDQKDSGKWIIALIINCLDSRQKKTFWLVFLKFYQLYYIKYKHVFAMIREEYIKVQAFFFYKF